MKSIKKIIYLIISLFSTLFVNAQTISKISNPTTNGSINVISNKYLIFNNNLYHSYKNADTTFSIIKTDGITSSLISNAGFPFTANTGAYPFISFNNKVFVNCKYGGVGNSKSLLGYISGSSIISIPNPNSNDYGILGYSKAIYNNNLYFGYDGKSPFFLLRYFLAKYDGSLITTIPFPTTNGSLIDQTNLIPFQGNLCFGYRDGTNTYLSAYNGSVMTLYSQPTTTGSISSFMNATEFNNNLYFPYNQSGVSLLAKFNGTSITLLSNPDAGTGFLTKTLPKIMNGNMYWVYTNAANKKQLVKCDGNTITLIPNPTTTGEIVNTENSGVDAKFEVYNNSIYIDYLEGGALSIIMKYDGTNSSYILPPVNSNVISFPVVFNNTLFCTIGNNNTDKFNIAQFNGTNFNIIPNPNAADAGAMSFFSAMLNGNLINTYVENASNYNHSFCKLSLPLPLQFTSFTATNNCNTTTFNWQTANEVNNKQFLVEQSINGADFTSIATVEPNTTNSYKYTTLLTTNHIQQSTIYYRIKQIDNDGKFSYSEILKVNINCNEKRFSIYPNPAKNILYIQGLTTTKNNLTITNVIGQSLLTLNNTTQKQINISSLNAGVYFIKINNEKVLKFIKE